MKKLISLLLVLATVLSCFMLTVTAAPTGELCTDEGMLPFEDVKSSHWFAEAVKFCYANGVIKGMNEYTFGFSGQLTRAQFVMMLANLEGVDTSTYTVTQFSDVKSSHWYYGAVAWAYENGIVNGMTETTFAPNGVLTRAQLAVVMNNYMNGKYEVTVNDNALDNFTDKPKAEYWYYDAMKFAVSAGLLSGNSDGTLAATGKVTRAQAAVIFKNFMEKYFYGDCEHSFTTADCTNAPKCEKCGLINGLPNGHRVTGYNCVDTLKCNVCDAEVAPSNIMHNFVDATCIAPRTCSNCGVTRGEAKGHNWKAATCTAPKTCVVCGTKEGNAKGHNWKAATCTAPKTCTVCKATEGKALGHTTTTGTCSRCGKVFSVTYDSIVSVIKAKGVYDSSLNCYILVGGDELDPTVVAYYANAGENYITIEKMRYLSDSTFDVAEMRINRNGTVHDYLYAYANSQAYVFMGEGTLDASKFTKNTTEGFSDYAGTLQSVYTTNMNSILKEMLTEADSILKSAYGGSIKDFGFKAY